jgi:cystathionine gamma-synthase/cystathionine gamma-lyase
MVLRGLKTLGVRVRQQCASAQAIAARLERHERVARVHYPGLRSHPGHALAERQMRGPGAMISLELTGGRGAAVAFLKGLRIFACAESLGGVESLAEHPAIMTHASVPEAARRALGISEGFVRLSVGLEAEADLWADIEQALAQ